MRARRVAILIDLRPQHPYHRASVAALRYAASYLEVSVEVGIYPTDTITDVGHLLADSSAIVVGPGSPYRAPDTVLECIRTAREAGVPLVGT